jgi:hypothetical protein
MAQRPSRRLTESSLNLHQTEKQPLQKVYIYRAPYKMNNTIQSPWLGMVTHDRTIVKFQKSVLRIYPPVLESHLKRKAGSLMKPP